MTEDWNVGKILTVTEGFFQKAGIESARLDAELLLADTLDLSRETLLSRREQSLTDIEISSYRERVRQRAGKKPVAYLLKRKEFFSMPFYVDENVLIPRPETEHLIERALNWLKLRFPIPNPESRVPICEVGTGSGCIAAALASARPDVQVTATEHSPEAAAVAVKNLADLGQLSRVRVVQCDLFPMDLLTRYDIVVSNPPYLSLHEFEALPAGIRRFEPKEALTDGRDGLTFYRRILKMAAKRMRPNGAVFFEISPGIETSFKGGPLLENLPFSLTAIYPDLAGLPRVAQLELIQN